MTNEEKIIVLLSENKNIFVESCNRRIAEENGKIEGADYMLRKMIHILKEKAESEE